MLPLGTSAPDFALPDTVSGRTIRYADIAGNKATLVMFICNHCPFVKHVLAELVRLGRDYSGPASASSRSAATMCTATRRTGRNA